MYGLYIQPEFKIPLISDPVNTEVKYKMAGEIYLTRALRQESLKFGPLVNTLRI